MKVIGLILFYPYYGLSFDYHMKKLYCVALRLWNTNICGIHQIHWQVHKGMVAMVLKAHKLISFNFANQYLAYYARKQNRFYDD